jgi:dihydroorotate dehydrogenase
MYILFRSFLFLFNPEKVHHFTMNFLKISLKIQTIKNKIERKYIINNESLEREVFGLKFKNQVGLAAGFDKDAKMIDALSSLGFGFIEIGTLTPKPQKGNPKPRLFRLKKDEAIVNRMGFNNLGVDEAVVQLKKRKSNCIIGGNIGKNKDTPNENAIDDYLFCFKKLFDFVDYFVVNVSSPNTPNLRSLQEKKPLLNILIQLQTENKSKQNPKPILLKIAPDLNEQQLDDIIEIVMESKISGVIATNTTISRDNLKTSRTNIEKIGMGGLSGKPLKNQSTWVINYLAEKSNKSFPIIGVGGIHSEKDAIEKIEAGADLIQLYTGFIYEGPSLIKRINKAFLKIKP